MVGDFVSAQQVYTWLTVHLHNFTSLTCAVSHLPGHCQWQICGPKKFLNEDNLCFTSLYLSHPSAFSKAVPNDVSSSISEWPAGVRMEHTLVSVVQGHHLPLLLRVPFSWLRALATPVFKYFESRPVKGLCLIPFLTRLAFKKVLVV